MASTAEKLLQPDADIIRGFCTEQIIADIHLVSIIPDAGTNGRWFGSDVVGATQWCLDENLRGRNIYWTVNQCRPGVNKKCEKQDVLAARFAHLDRDAPKDGRTVNWEAMLQELTDFRLSPSFIVHSGNGFQAFWRLEDYTPQWDHIEQINHAMIDELQGDKGTWNIDRIMRMPGTINWPDRKKRARGCVPIMATIAVEDDGVTWPTHALPARPVDRQARSSRANDDHRLLVSSDLKSGPYLARLRKMIDQPSAAFDHEDRSRWAFAIACEMLRSEYSDDAVTAILLNPANAGCAHIAGQPNSVRAAAKCLQGAKAAIEQSGEAGVSIKHFRAYMPTHQYIFMPSREFWPASSVNSRIPPIDLFDKSGEPVLDKKGEQVKIAANQWLDENAPVEQMTWAPGETMIIPDRLISDGGWISHRGASCFNLYRPPLAVSGNPTKAQQWVAHVHRVYPTDAEHIIQWLAHRVQRPHEKINHALVLGGAQGIGKDTLLEPVKHAIGPWNFAEVSPQHMLGRFNGFVKSVILRVSEARDLGDIDRFAFYDHMKTYTAAPPDVLRVDEKHLREYAVFNVCGVIITSNHKSDGIYLPADDRRHFVAWSECSRDSFSDDYWTQLYSWYANGGNGDVTAYLQQLDLSMFNPKAPPPKTTAFWDIVSANRAPEDAELADALDKQGYPTATTLGMIMHYAADDFRAWLSDRRNSRKVPHRLEECGYVPVRNPAARDGLWKVNGARSVIYAKRELSIHDGIAAAERLVEQARSWRNDQ